MIACLDVDYREAGACIAALLFHQWSDAVAADERVVQVPEVQPYVPGEFFRRELPCLMAILKTLPEVESIVIDGYVWLNDSKPGLGAHLYEALGAKVPIIGVAKTAFKGSEQACFVFRGESQRPLYVTAAGLAMDVAADHVRSMHGSYRIPTLLKRVDFLCRHEGKEAA